MTQSLASQLRSAGAGASSHAFALNGSAAAASSSSSSSADTVVQAVTKELFQADVADFAKEIESKKSEKANLDSDFTMFVAQQEKEKSNLQARIGVINKSIETLAGKLSSAHAEKAKGEGIKAQLIAKNSLTPATDKMIVEKMSQIQKALDQHTKAKVACEADKTKIEQDLKGLEGRVNQRSAALKPEHERIQKAIEEINLRKNAYDHAYKLVVGQSRQPLSEVQLGMCVARIQSVKDLCLKQINQFQAEIAEKQKEGVALQGRQNQLQEQYSITHRLLMKSRHERLAPLKKAADDEITAAYNSACSVGGSESQKKRAVDELSKLFSQISQPNETEKKLTATLADLMEKSDALNQKNNSVKGAKVNAEALLAKWNNNLKLCERVQELLEKNSLKPVAPRDPAPSSGLMAALHSLSSAMSQAVYPTPLQR